MEINVSWPSHSVHCRSPHSAVWLMSFLRLNPYNCPKKRVLFFFLKTGIISEERESENI